MSKEDEHNPLVLDVRDLTLPIINSLPASSTHEIRDGKPVIVVTDSEAAAAIKGQMTDRDGVK